MENRYSAFCQNDGGPAYGWEAVGMGTATGQVTAWMPQTDVPVYNYINAKEIRRFGCACLKNCKCVMSWTREKSSCLCVNGKASPTPTPAVLAHSSSGPRRNVPRGVGRYLLPEPDCAPLRRLWQAEVPVGDPRNVFPEIVDKLDSSKLGKCSCMCSNMLK